MRDRIRKRLTEDRSDALERIAAAEQKTYGAFSERGTTHSSMFHRAINEDNKTGLADYMDRSVYFIRQVAGSSALQYADELRDAATRLKQEIVARPKLGILVGVGHGDLEAKLDRVIERKLEDFELNFIEGKDMNATTQNTVNIINSNISNSLLQISQSGKDSISKDTALKLRELMKSKEIMGLPENDRLHVLDQVDNVVKELEAPTTDKGKVHRALVRLGGFLRSVAPKVAAEIVTKLATAWL
jgi:hypothetical protein